VSPLGEAKIKINLSFPRIAPRSVDDTEDHHFAVDDSVVNHIRVAHKRDTPDSWSILDFLRTFGKLRDAFEYTFYTRLESRCGERIFSSDGGQDRIKLGEREL